MKKRRIIISTLCIIILLSFISLFILIRKGSLASDISFTSKNYSIEENIITNISPNTDIELFNKYFDTTNCNIIVTNENNEPLTNGFIYTGSKTNIYDTANNLINTYTNIITGDINYDGLVDIKDIYVLSNYLIEDNNLDDYQKKAIDLNNDSNIKINDLTLLEEYLNTNYKSIAFNEEEITLMSNDQERLLPTINPNIILNQNLNWTSSNEDAITVDETGKVTAHNEGESIITATTKDGLSSATIRIIVDNKPGLARDRIEIYTGPKTTSVDIKAIDYQNLTCSTENEYIATCTIENKKLIVTPVNEGETKISVTSPYYGTSELEVQITYVYFSIQPKASCLPPNVSAAGGAIVNFNMGPTSLKSISDREIVRFAYIFRNNISIETGSKTGDAIVTYVESNGNNESSVRVYVYTLGLSSTSGTTTIGEDLTTDISAENVGNLSCNSSNNEIATCEISEEKLIVHPITTGEATITVFGDKCGSITYNATITNTGGEVD
ncbi:MAG: Ig-like domain-containing protein [Bacilli bacterium]|nr:Ig-like domain-containing protein [Bacilli bacterium]